MSISNKAPKPIYIENLASMPSTMNTNMIGAVYYIANIKSLWLYTGGVSGTGTTSPTLSTGTVGQPSATYNEGSGKFFGLVSGITQVSYSTLSNADVTNSTTTPKLITGSVLRGNFYTETETDTLLNAKQDALGYTPVPDTRTIAGLNLTTNLTRDAILGVITNGYYRRTGTNTYDIRTVDNLKSDLGLGSLAYSSSISLGSLSDVSVSSPSNGQTLTYDGTGWVNANKPSYDASEIGGLGVNYRWLTDSYISTWNGKQSTITGAASTITSDDLSANSILISNPSGKVAVSAVSSTQLLHLSGVTSNIQTQLNGKFNTPAGTTSQYVRGDGSLIAFPSIPSIPSIMTTAEGNTGTAETQRTINALNLKSIILNHSPAGSRPASDVQGWAKAENKPDYTTDEVQATLANQYVSASDKVTWNNKQNALGYTPVPPTRTIAGLDLTENRTRDGILGVSTNGYYRRTGTNTYDIRTVANLKTDLGLGSLAYSSSISLGGLSDVSVTSPSNGQILTHNGTGWVNANKPDYTTDEVEATLSNQYVSASDKVTWNNKQNALGFTPENVANKINSIRDSGADNTSYVSELGVKNYVDTKAVPVTRTIAGIDLSANITLDSLLGTSTAGYVRRTAFADTYDIRTVTNMRSDLSINNVTNESKATMFASPTFTGTTTAAAINVNGAVGLRASALGSAATQILVVSADPASTTRTVQTRTPAQMKSDIGVGSVLNYGIATQAQAEAASPVNTVYMTPLRTKQAIEANKPTYNASEIGGLGTNYRWLTDSYISTWNGKQNSITGAASTIISDDLSANSILITNPSGKVAASSTSSGDLVRLSYLSGVTSNVQTQLDDLVNNKFNTPTGTTSQYVRGNGSLATFPSIPSSLNDLSDVSVSSPSNGQILTYTALGGWQAASKPSYNASEIGGLGANYRWLTDSYISTWNNKENAITKGTTAQYFRGDMSLATFPSIPSIPSVMTQTDITNGTTTQRTINASLLKANFYTETETDALLNGKQSTITGAATTITSDDLSANSILITNPSGKVAASSVSSGDLLRLSYLSGVTSNVQTQLNGKENTITKGTVAQYFRGDMSLATFPSIPSSLNDLSDVSVSSPSNSQILTYTALGGWQAANKPSYSASEIGGLGANYRWLTDSYISAWNGKQSAITGAATTITSSDLTASRALISNSSGKVAVSAVTSTELGYLSGVTSAIQTQLNGKAASSHTHTIAQVTGLQGALDGKAASTHTHTIAQVTGLQGALDGKQSTITGAATTITSDDLSANSILISNPSGKVVTSAVSSTKLVHLSGVTSDIQTQLNGKAASSHTHTIAQVTGLQGALDGKAPSSHSHNILDFSDLESDLGLNGLRIKQYSNSTSPDGEAWHHALRLQHGGYPDNGYYREILLPFFSDRAFISRVNNSTSKEIVELATQPWVLENSRGGSWTPTWAQVSGKPGWIGANKPDYTTDDVTATLSNQYVSASDKLTWNGKQNALGFTPENAANKRTSIRTSGAENTSYVSELGVKNYVDGIAPVKLLRARSGTNALTIYSNSAVTGIGSQLTRGDTIMVEVHSDSAITTATPKILTFTLSQTSISFTEAGSVSFTTLTGGILQVWSLGCALISGALTFGNAGTLQMSKSGTDMVITNTTWTPYIGRIWRVVGN